MPEKQIKKHSYEQVVQEDLKVLSEGDGQKAVQACKCTIGIVKLN